MKRILTILLFLLFSIVGYSQNGGQFFENNVIRIQYLGYSLSKHSFKVVNKQVCEARIRTRAEQDPAVDIQVIANDSSVVQVSRPTPQAIIFKAKAETSCVSNPDMGWLEINTGRLPLPLNEDTKQQIQEKRGILVKLSRGVLTVTTNDNITYNQTVEVYSVNGIKYYYKSFRMNKNSVLDLHNQIRLGLNFISIRLDRDGIVNSYLIRSFY
jgi:hypothetical protein